MKNKNRTKCEIWSRCVGYLRPTSTWNEGKRAEFEDRKMFDINTKSDVTSNLKEAINGTKTSKY